MIVEIPHIAVDITEYQYNLLRNTIEYNICEIVMTPAEAIKMAGNFQADILRRQSAPATDGDSDVREEASTATHTSTSTSMSTSPSISLPVSTPEDATTQKPPITTAELPTSSTTTSAPAPAPAPAPASDPGPPSLPTPAAPTQEPPTPRPKASGWVTYHILVNIHDIELILHRGKGFYTNPLLPRDPDAPLEYPLPPSTERHVKNEADRTAPLWSSRILAGQAKNFAMTFDMTTEYFYHGLFLIESVELRDARHHSVSIFEQIMAPRSGRHRRSRRHRHPAPRPPHASTMPPTELALADVSSASFVPLVDDESSCPNYDSLGRQPSSDADRRSNEDDDDDDDDAVGGAVPRAPNKGGTANHDLERQLFVITYNKHPIGHMELVINIDHPYGVLVPDMWVKLYDFIMPLKDGLFNTIGVYQRYLQFCRFRDMRTRETLAQAQRDGPIEPLELIAAAVAEITTVQPVLAPKEITEIMVNITNPDTFWIQDQTDHNTWALVLHTTCFVRYCNDNRAREMEVTLDFMRNEIYKCRSVAQQSASASLVSPFTFNFRVRPPLYT